jgi:hypothetical protein
MRLGEANSQVWGSEDLNVGGPGAGRCRLSRSWTTEDLCRQVYNERRGALLFIETQKRARKETSEESGMIVHGMEVLWNCLQPARQWFLNR